MVLSACEIKVSKVQTNNTMNGVIMLPQRAIIEHTPMPVFLERKKRVGFRVKTRKLVFCFAPFVFLGSIVLTSLSSLFTSPMGFTGSYTGGYTEKDNCSLYLLFKTTLL